MIAGFPQHQLPFVDKDGILTQTWYQLLIALFMRTGSGGGNAGFVSGDLKAVGHATVPAGWLLCNGQAVSRTTYSDLFTSIGTTWGVGDGVTTFNVPDIGNKSPVGASGAKPLGSSGGAESVVIAKANLPAYGLTVTDPGHTHTITDPQHIHGITDPTHFHASLVAAATNTAGAAAGAVAAGNTAAAATGITVNAAATGVTNVAAATGVTVASGGSGTALPTLGKYAAVNWLIKI